MAKSPGHQFSSPVCFLMLLLASVHVKNTLDPLNSLLIACGIEITADLFGVLFHKL